MPTGFIFDQYQGKIYNAVAPCMTPRHGRRPQQQHFKFWSLDGYIIRPCNNNMATVMGIKYRLTSKF